MTVDRGTWARDILNGLGVPVTHENMVAMVAWMHAEDGSAGALNRNNPLNTSMSVPGAPGINSDGVRAYPSYQVGLAATIKTIRLGYYDKVRAALRRGDDATAVIRAVNASPWAARNYDLGVVSVGRQQLRQHPGWTKPPSDGKGDKTQHAPKSAPSGGDKVVVYLGELDHVVRSLVDRADPLAAAQRTSQRVMDDLHLDAYLTNAPVPYGVVDRHRMVKAAQELEDTVEPKYGFNAVATGLGQVAEWVATFRQRLIEVDRADGKSPRSRKKIEQMLRALRRNGATPEQVAALEAVWLGGLHRGRPPGRRPSSPRPRQGSGGRPAPGNGGNGGNAGNGGNGGNGGKGGTNTAIRQMLAVARQQVGTTDHGKNTTRYGAWYGMNGQAWCAMFVSWVFDRSGHNLPNLASAHNPKGFAYVPWAINDLRAKGELHSRPKVGDVFLTNYNGGHTGIVSNVNSDGSFSTIEGNAGPSTDRVVTGRRTLNDGRGYYFWSPLRA